MERECHVCTPQTYNKGVLKYLKNPKYMGSMKNPDAVGLEQSFCGDAMKMYVKIGKKKVKGKEVEIVKEVRFETTGCGGAVATAEAVSEFAKGKTIKEVEKLTTNKILKLLGGLPEPKIHCCEMSVKTLGKAIENWKKKN